MTNEHGRAIDEVRLTLEAAENAADADAAAALMADDVVLMVPDFPVQEGKEASAAFLRDVMAWLFEHFHRQVSYVSAEVAVIGDTAFDRGTFAFTCTSRTAGETTQVTGKYFWLLRRTSGSWKVARMIVCRDSEDEPEPLEGSDSGSAIRGE